MDKFYSTYVLIPYECGWAHYMQILQFTVSPLIKALQAAELIDSFHFLLHGGDNDNLGVPRDLDDSHLYVHIRLELAEDVECGELNELLEQYGCELPRVNGKFRGRLKAVSLKDIVRVTHEIDGKDFFPCEEAWRLLGQLSAWALALVDAHVFMDEFCLADNLNQYCHFLENIFDMIPVGGVKVYGGGFECD